METVDDVYENLPTGPTLWEEVEKLQHDNTLLKELIRSLESDIEKLCATITEMKQKQENLAKNISELYKTAKTEIERKDKIISELRNEIEKLSQQKNYRIPQKRDRNSSPFLSHCDDPSGKRFKYDKGVMKPVMHHSRLEQHDQNKSRSKSRDRYSRFYERSHESEIKTNKHDQGRRHGPVSEKNLPHAHKTSSITRKDAISEMKVRKGDSRPTMIYNLVKNEKNRIMDVRENVIKGKNDLLPKEIKKEPGSTNATNLNIEKRPEESNKLPFNNIQIKIEDNTDFGAKQIKEVNNVTANGSLKEPKQNKAKIEEVTKKLFERLEEEAKQEDVNEQNISCPVSVSLCNINDIPQRTDFIISASDLTMKDQNEEPPKTKESCDVPGIEEFIKREKEHSSNLLPFIDSDGLNDKALKERKTFIEKDKYPEKEIDASKNPLPPPHNEEILSNKTLGNPVIGKHSEIAKDQNKSDATKESNKEKQIIENKSKNQQKVLDLSNKNKLQEAVKINIENIETECISKEVKEETQIDKGNNDYKEAELSNKSNIRAEVKKESKNTETENKSKRVKDTTRRKSKSNESHNDHKSNKFDETHTESKKMEPESKSKQIKDSTRRKSKSKDNYKEIVKEVSTALEKPVKNPKEEIKSKSINAEDDTRNDRKNEGPDKDHKEVELAKKINPSGEKFKDTEDYKEIDKEVLLVKAVQEKIGSKKNTKVEDGTKNDCKNEHPDKDHKNVEVVRKINLSEEMSKETEKVSSAKMKSKSSSLEKTVETAQEEIESKNTEVKDDTKKDCKNEDPVKDHKNVEIAKKINLSEKKSKDTEKVTKNVAKKHVEEEIQNKVEVKRETNKESENTETGNTNKKVKDTTRRDSKSKENDSEPKETANKSIADKTAKYMKKTELENKSKKVRDSTKKSKNKSPEIEVVEESDRVLRSASKRNRSKEKISKSTDELEPPEEPKTDHNENDTKPNSCTEVDLSGSFSVNLSHDGEIPVLHIEESGNSQVNLFDPIFTEQNGYKDTIIIPLDNNPPVITSSPVHVEPINGVSSSNNVSPNESNISLITNCNSVEKVFNTSSARKRRRVILKMID